MYNFFITWSTFCDYSDVYIHVKGTISIPNIATPSNSNKKAIFKNCDPFTKCISEINNTEVDDAHHNRIYWYLFENIRTFMAILKK